MEENTLGHILGQNILTKQIFKFVIQRNFMKKKYWNIVENLVLKLA